MFSVASHFFPSTVEFHWEEKKQPWLVNILHDIRAPHKTLFQMKKAIWCFHVTFFNIFTFEWYPVIEGHYEKRRQIQIGNKWDVDSKQWICPEKINTFDLTILGKNAKSATFANVKTGGLGWRKEGPFILPVRTYVPQHLTFSLLFLFNLLLLLFFPPPPPVVGMSQATYDVSHRSISALCQVWLGQFKSADTWAF